MRLGLGGVTLESVLETDAAFILELRTDPELGRYLSSTLSDLGAQREWILAYREREAKGEEYYFLIRNDSRPVGTVRLYDFTDLSFCWGSWLIQRGTDPRVAPASVVLVYDFGFDGLEFSRSHFQVRKGNVSVGRFHLSMGAKIVRSDERNDDFEISRDSYFQNRKRLLRMAGERKKADCRR